MKEVTIEQIQKAEELGIQELIRPSMSSSEARKIIDSEIKSRLTRESKEALKLLLQKGLRCGCEVEQMFYGSQTSRWGVVNKITESTGKVGLYIYQGYGVIVEAKYLVARPFEKDETLVYVPLVIQKEILRGEYGEKIRSAIQSKVMPKTGIHICFLPIELAKELNL